MIKILLIIVISIIIASLLFTILKKAVRLALFVALVFIVFLVISNFIFPESNLFQKGKNYILEKTGSLVDSGKEKVTSYVIAEVNESVSDAKEGIIHKVFD